MPTIGVADVLVVPQFKNLQKTVGRELDGAAGPAAARAGKSAGVKMSSALGVALKAGAAAQGLLTGGILGLALTKGFGRLQAIENAKAKLVGLGNSAQTVEQIMKDATKAVTGTAFGLDEAATVAASAVAAGVKPGKDLEGVLTTVADTATIAGASMSDMGAIFGSVAARGKLQGDDLMQLQSRGVPVLQFLAKHYGITAQAASDMVSKGQVDFANFEAAMKQGLGGAAQASGKTLQGAFKNTMASLGRIGASLLSGVYPKIQQFFSNAINWLKPLEGGAKVAGAAIGGFLAKAIEGVSGLYDLLIKGDIAGKLHHAFGWTEDSTVVAFLFAVHEALVKLPAALNDLARKSAAAAKALYTARTPILIVSGLIATALIPYWVQLGVTALKSASQQRIAWLMTQGAAFKAGYANLWAFTTTVAGWVLMGTQALIQGARVAAGWLLAMGPVGWVIGAIAAVVAAFVLAYNNIGWFKDGVDAAMQWVGQAVAAAFQWVQDAIGAVVNWFTGTVVPLWNGAINAIGGFFNWLWTGVIKPVFDAIGGAIGWVYNSVIVPIFSAISTAVNAVGAVFSWLWTTILKPVFDSASVIIGGFYLFFRGVFQVIVSILVNIVAPVLMGWWNTVVQVFAGIGQTISDWWNAAVGIFNTVVSFFQTVLATAFTWLYQTVVKPVFDAIGNAIQWTWLNVIKPTIDVWTYFFRTVLPAAFNWLYNNVVKPVFDAIGNAIQWVWNVVIKPVIDSWVYFFQKILAPAVQWLYNNIIKPTFDSIGTAIKWTWDHVIKPVFDFLSNTITKTIPDAFRTGVEIVKKVWQTIQDIAKAPVRFVVDTVINDGLIASFNRLADVLPGVDHLPRVALPKGFSSGGWTGPGSKYQPAGIVHADEFVIRKESQRDMQRRAPGLLDAINRLGADAVGYATGGRVRPLSTLSVTNGWNHVHKGVDFAAAVGTPVYATENGRVSWSGPGVRAPGVWGGNEIHIDGASGIQEWFAHLSSMAVRVGQMVRAGQQIGLSGNTGITSGPHLHFGTFNGGWPNDIDPLAYLGGAGKPSGGGFNPFGFITDLAGKIVGQMKNAFPGAGFMVDASIGLGQKVFGSIGDWIKRTFLGGGSAAGDPTLYDLGGILPPGVSQVVNRTGRPEAILNPQQWADISRLAGVDGGRAPVGGFTNNGTIHVRDEMELARIIMTRQRDALAVHR